MASKKTAFLMVQGTMSNAGKSLIVAGLCRVFQQDGYKVVPFKSQNMALNSYITEDGLEMGRAQVMQAEAARIKPSVYMNPILLKPNDDVGSQVIVNGEVLGNMRAREYFEYKKKLVPYIESAINKLKDEADIIVIEGAGSPAEINLKDNDIVNMGMAKLVDAPVLIVGDIDRGGVFAQLLGTLELLDEDEKERVKGLIINKFRGDKTILDPGIDSLEKRCGVRVTGVVPYMDINLEDEDSLSERFEKINVSDIDIAVIRLPHISNFTDFAVFDEIENISVRYVKSIRDFGNPDLLIIPGSKNTISDMRWLRESGLDATINKYASKNGLVFGICGGYQMLGKRIEDPLCVESGGVVEGLGLLNVKTILKDSKNRKQTQGKIVSSTGVFQSLFGKSYSGYEIHMGETVCLGKDLKEFTESASGYCKDNIYGTYVHGIFDSEEMIKEIVDILARKKGVSLETSNITDYSSFKEGEYDKLADTIREYMDMDYIYKIMGIENDKHQY